MELLPCTHICDAVKQNQSEIKGPIRDKKNLQITLQINKNTFQSQHVPFFLKKYLILTEKQLFIRFHSVGTECCFCP